MAIKSAGLQLSDALVRKARLARCRVIEMNSIASWGLEHGGVIENPTSSFPRCRSALIARNCVRASWNFLSLSLSLPFSFLFVRFLSRIWIVFFSFLYLASEGGKEKRFLCYLTLSRGVFESFWSSWSKGKTSVSKDACFRLSRVRVKGGDEIMDFIYLYFQFANLIYDEKSMKARCSSQGMLANSKLPLSWNLDVDRRKKG